MKFTKSEMEIMEVLWATEKPMSRADILAAPHRFKDSSIHIFLNSMLEKGAIKEAGIIKCRKTYGRTFAPAITQEHYWAQLIYNEKKGPRLCGDPDLASLISEIMFQAEIPADSAPAFLADVRDKYDRRCWL